MNNFWLNTSTKITPSINALHFVQMETLLTYTSVSLCGPLFVKFGISGKDLHKREKPVLPEAMGLIAGIILCLFIRQPTVLLCTMVGLWIGALDDIIDLQWRYKLIGSALAYLPLYQNLTTVVIFGRLIYLGPLYHVYMLLWCIWCGNAINIHAGINGLEVGQTIVIALGLLPIIDDDGAVTLVSYICVAAGLLALNWYPSMVFVGDSWCYMSGMFFVSIAQHETETLAFFMLPQIINTLLSLPELTGYCDCPRHRMPKYDSAQDVLVASGKGTLMNIVLKITGPMHEKKLLWTLLAIQVMCVLIGYKFKS
jgi:UDP-N-acetylglucosamine--dolichyl-phosphate N-acetylglucosaminephosphotransferase